MMLPFAILIPHSLGVNEVTGKPVTAVVSQPTSGK